MSEKIVINGWFQKKGYYFHEWSSLYFILYDSGKLVGFKNKPEGLLKQKPSYLYNITYYTFTPFEKGRRAYLLLRTANRNKISIEEFSHESIFFRDNWLNALNFVKFYVVNNKSINTIPIQYKLQDLEEIKELKDYEPKRIVGIGSFGIVIQVYNTCDSSVLALKICETGLTCKKESAYCGIYEINVLSAINHPFIIEINNWFLGQNRYFILMEFMPGGNLLFHLKRNKRFTEYRVKIYAAELTLALSYLHQRNIIYRDLKSENIMIGTDGHLKIVDFGLARCGINYYNRCFTYCGALDYISPEMAKRQEYWHAVDWWGLGVVLFELLNGYRPFTSDSEKELLTKITGTEPNFITVLSQDSKIFTKELLIKDPEKRLGGSDHGSDEVKNHIYFFDIDWDAVFQKRIPPLFVPVLSDPLDLKYFENHQQPSECVTVTQFTDF